MTSRLVQQLFDEAGLDELLLARRQGLVPCEPEWHSKLARADLLVLGAAAGIARQRECGDEVSVYVPTAPPPRTGLAVVGAPESDSSTLLLRNIAMMRLLGPLGLRIVFDFGALGIGLAQIALEFGASDFAGPVVHTSAIAEPGVREARAWSDEARLRACIERAGLRPIFLTFDLSATSGHRQPAAQMEIR